MEVWHRLVYSTWRSPSLLGLLRKWQGHEPSWSFFFSIGVGEAAEEFQWVSCILSWIARTRHKQAWGKAHLWILASTPDQSRAQKDPKPI